MRTLADAGNLLPLAHIDVLTCEITRRHKVLLYDLALCRCIASQSQTKGDITMSRMCETYLDLLVQSSQQRLAMANKKMLITARRDAECMVTGHDMPCIVDLRTGENNTFNREVLNAF